MLSAFCAVVATGAAQKKLTVSKNYYREDDEVAKPKNHQKSKSETITVERNVIVKGTNIRVKSVFDGNIPL